MHQFPGCLIQNGIYSVLEELLAWLPGYPHIIHRVEYMHWCHSHHASGLWEWANSGLDLALCFHVCYACGLYGCVIKALQDLHLAWSHGNNEGTGHLLFYSFVPSHRQSATCSSLSSLLKAFCSTTTKTFAHNNTLERCDWKINSWLKKKKMTQQVCDVTVFVEWYNTKIFLFSFFNSILTLVLREHHISFYPVIFGHHPRASHNPPTITPHRHK